MSVGPLAAAGGATDISSLANYGVLGIFALILLAFARTQIKREQDRADRLEKRMDEMNEATKEKVIPALEAASTAVQSSVELIKDIQHERALDDARRRPRPER